MLVKLLHDVGIDVSLPGLPPSVVPIEAIEFRYDGGQGKHVKLTQFLVTLAYAITDYKCQGQTFNWIIVDLKRPSSGNSPSDSPYVQLSRAKSLDHLSIMRPFHADELHAPIPIELLDELQWQEEMAMKTAHQYS